MRNVRAPDPLPASRPAEDYGTFGADYRFGPVEATVDPGLRQLCTCWNDIRSARTMPTRPELNPFVLRGMLKFAQLFDIIDGGRDFRFRVMGSVLVEQTGLHMTGKCVSELDNAPLRARIHNALTRVCETKEPVRLFAQRSAVGHLAHKQIEGVYLPLGDETGLTHVISGIIFGKHRAAA